MKQIYLCILCVGLTICSQAQTYYWVGGASGNWNTAANWSTTTNGAGGTVVPNNAAHNVILDKNAVIEVDIAFISLSTLTVTNSVTATLYAENENVLMELMSTNTANPALKIDANSMLIDSTSGEIDLMTDFPAGSKAVIDGTWRFGNLNFPNSSAGATFMLPEDAEQGNEIQINGRMEIGTNALSPFIEPFGDEYVFVNAGAVYSIESDGGLIPDLAWHPESIIEIVGVVNFGFSVDENEAVGTINYHSPNQNSGPENDIILDLFNITVAGDLNILNTNNTPLIISGTRSSGNPGDIVVTVEGDFNVSGNSHVVLSKMNGEEQMLTVQVNGDFNAGGTAFDLQVGNVPVNVTTLGVAGNFNHSAGTFDATSLDTDVLKDLYIIELNGTSNQTVFSHEGSIDNNSNEVTLRLNNAAGATLISPLEVGRLSFASASKGILSTTATNLLTINNTSTGSLTVNSPDNTGYVSGPVSRKTASEDAYIFPTGKNGAYRPIQVTPESDAASEYIAEYFAATHSDGSALPPLRGITNEEYWSLNRISGSDAVVTLTIVGKIPNSVAADEIVVAGYNGADWISLKGTTGTSITDGNAVTGDVSSEALSEFGLFTLGLINDSPLPIELLSFNAAKGSGNTAQLNWEITSNSTPEKFEIMRSVNGRDFSSIGTVHATELLKYTFTDNELPVGTTYYRLRLLDIDGTVTLSKVIAVINGQSGIMLTAMVPTIVTNVARLDVSSSKKGTLQLIVTDMNGRIIQRQSTGIFPGSQPVIMNLQNLSSGAYQVTGLFEGIRTSTIRFVKQ